jgi:hypothetical protein
MHRDTPHLHTMHFDLLARINTQRSQSHCSLSGNAATFNLLNCEMMDIIHFENDEEHYLSERFRRCMIMTISISLQCAPQLQCFSHPILMCLEKTQQYLTQHLSQCIDCSPMLQPTSSPDNCVNATECRVVSRLQHPSRHPLHFLSAYHLSDYMVPLCSRYAT